MIEADFFRAPFRWFESIERVSMFSIAYVVQNWFVEHRSNYVINKFSLLILGSSIRYCLQFDLMFATLPSRPFCANWS